MDEKKFVKHLKKAPGMVWFVLFLIAAVILIVSGFNKNSEVQTQEPAEFSGSLTSGAYCTIEAQYMTEAFAELVDSQGTDYDYYYVADEDFEWVCVRVPQSRANEFTDLIEFTYDESITKAPAKIAFTGTLETMESDLSKLASDYYTSVVGEKAPSRLYMAVGRNDLATNRTTIFIFGGVFAALALFFLFRGIKRSSNGRKALAKLTEQGWLEAVATEYGAPNTVRLSKSKTANALGDNFIFLMNSHKVLTYDQVTKMTETYTYNKGRAVNRILTLQTTEGKYNLCTESARITGGIVAQAESIITSKNPNCAV